MAQAAITSATIIGAGPAGSLTAALLARRGLDVLLVDKSSFPRHKVCGCCLSPSALRALRQAGFESVVEGGTPLRELRVYDRMNKISFSISDSISISRSVLDNALVERAKEAGAQFRGNTHAVIGGIDGYRRFVELDDEQVSAKVVVAADGLAGTSVRNIPAMQSIVANNSKIGTGTISAAGASDYEEGVIYMCVDDNGYVGMVRLEDGSLDIAAALDQTYLRGMHNPADAVARILRRSRLPIPQDLFDADWRGTVPLTRKRASIAAPRVFAVGDAASYVEPFTGEGIAWAFISALNVVPIAERAAIIWNDDLIKQWTNVYGANVRPLQGKTSLVAGVLRNRLIREVGANVLARSPRLSSLLVESIHA